MTGLWKGVAVARKELRQIRRDRRTLLILLFVPAFFLLIYGYALNFDIRHVRLALQDNTPSDIEFIGGVFQREEGVFERE